MAAVLKSRSSSVWFSPRVSPFSNGRDHHRKGADGYGVILAATINDHPSLFDHGGARSGHELSRERAVRVHLIGATAFAIRRPPGDRMMNIVDLGEVAHTVKRALHHPDQGLASTNGRWNRSRPLHLNPVGAPKSVIHARKSRAWPDAGSRAAALSPGDKQEQTR